MILPQKNKRPSFELAELFVFSRRRPDRRASEDRFDCRDRYLVVSNSDGTDVQAIETLGENADHGQCRLVAGERRGRPFAHRRGRRHRRLRQ